MTKKFTRGKLKIFIPLLFLFFLWTGISLTAQESNTPEKNEEEQLEKSKKKNDLEIVVSASRIYEDMKAVAASVYIIDKETINNAPSIIDALNTIPDIDVLETSPGKRYVTMGGFGENGFARVLILKDGIPLNRPDMSSFSWTTLSPENIERIEVIKGGYTAQYGDQAVAGIINIITKKNPENFFKATIGADTAMSNKESFSGSYGDDNIDIFFSVYREGIYPARKYSDSDMFNMTLAPSYHYGFLNITSELFYSGSKYQIPGGLTKTEYENNPNDAKNSLDSASDIFYGFNISPKLNFTNLNIALPISLNKTETATNMTSYGSYYNTDLLSLNVLPQASYDFYIGDHSLLTPILGFDLKYNKIEVERFTTADRTTSQDKDVAVDRTTLGPWLLLNYSLLDKFFVKAGVRCEYGITGAQFEETSVENGNNFTIPFSWNVSTSWIPFEGLKIFGAYSRVFRYPLLDEQVVYSGWGNKFYDDINPETGHMVSVGAEWTNDHFGLNFVPFFSYMSDEIVYDSTLSRNINSAETMRIGLTANAKFNSQYFDATAGYRWVNATYAKGENKDKFIPLIPAHKWKVTAKGKIPLGFYIQSSFILTSDYYVSGDEANNLAKIPYGTQWSASTGWTSDWGLTVKLYCNNILGDRTPSTVYYSSFSSKYGYYPVDDRKWGVEISWRLQPDKK